MVHTLYRKEKKKRRFHPDDPESLLRAARSGGPMEVRLDWSRRSCMRRGTWRWIKRLFPPKDFFWRKTGHKITLHLDSWPTFFALQMLFVSLKDGMHETKEETERLTVRWSAMMKTGGVQVGTRARAHVCQTATRLSLLQASVYPIKENSVIFTSPDGQLGDVSTPLHTPRHAPVHTVPCALLRLLSSHARAHGRVPCAGDGFCSGTA